MTNDTKKIKQTMSAKGLQWLKKIEMLHLTTYDDQTGKPTKVWVKGATIGYGHLILQTEWDKYKNGISVSEAEELILKDLEPHEKNVRDCVKCSLNPNQFDALVILGFNIGLKGLRTSSVVSMLNGGTSSYPTIEEAWKAWNKSQGKVNKGIMNRRNAEWIMFSKGEYTHW